MASGINEEFLKALCFERMTEYSICCREVDQHEFLDYIRPGVAEVANPGIYVFVAPGPEQLQVLYVGKAGKGLWKRIGEHAAGYKRRMSAFKNSGAQDVSCFSALHATMRENKNSELQIWFRKSNQWTLSKIFDRFPDPPDIAVSSFSLEEEALILWLRSIQHPLVNSACPPIVVMNITESPRKPDKEPIIKSDDIGYFDKLKEKVRIRSEPVHYNKWVEIIDGWDDGTRASFVDVVRRLEKAELLKIPKVIKKYSSGPIRSPYSLVFGEIANKKFSGKRIIFDAYGKTFAFYDPQGEEDSEPISIEDYLDG